MRHITLELQPRRLSGRTVSVEVSAVTTAKYAAKRLIEEAGGDPGQHWFLLLPGQPTAVGEDIPIGELAGDKSMLPVLLGYCHSCAVAHEGA